jgi:hypothetical protein
LHLFSLSAALSVTRWLSREETNDAITTFYRGGKAIDPSAMSCIAFRSPTAS